MKTIFITFVIFFITATVSFCQTAQIEISSTGDGKNENLQIYQTYFFKKPSIEPSVFQKDSIMLSANNINSDFPRIELYENSTFCFFYNITSDDQEIISFNTGERIRKTNRTSYIKKGDYQIIHENDSKEKTEDKSLTLNFEDGSVSNYKILEQEKDILMVKQ